MLKWPANAPGRRNQRHASTATALAPKPPVKDLETTFHTPVRTVLHKTAAFAPRVLPSPVSDSAPSTAAFWEEVLDGTYDRLNSIAAEAPARVVGESNNEKTSLKDTERVDVVYGCDQYSGARDLITALLEEPFAPEARRDAIRQRWTGANQDVERTIAYVYYRCSTL